MESNQKFKFKSNMATRAMMDELEYYRDYKRDKNEIDLRFYLFDEDTVEDKIASGHYPTLPVLTNLQRKLGQGPKDPDAKDVPPFPSRRTKEEIFDAEKYKHLDLYAKSLVPGPHESGEDFAARLFSRCNSNLDKVRTAFYFVCTASSDGLTEVESESQMYSDFRQMHEKRSEQSVFDCLVGLAQVPNKRITGYKKGANYESGLEVALGGSWLACYVAGEWRFVDAFWGAEGVSGFEAGNFANIDDEGNVLNTQRCEGQRVYLCDEFYFLTDPEKLILSHFPEEHLKEWQLLARPLSLDEFKKMPRFFGLHRDSIGKFEIIPLSHPLNVIVGDKGTIEIFLRETSEEMYTYKPKIGIHKNSLNKEAREAIKKQFNIEGHISKPSRMGKGVVKFKFVPPCRAKFKLKIFLERTIDQQTSKAEYVEYVIHCPQEDKHAREIPAGSKVLDEFGPGKRLLEAGLRTDEPGELQARDGAQKLMLNLVNLRRIVFDFELMGSGNNSVPQDQKHLLVWTNGKNVFIMFLSPDSGLFALVLQEDGVPLCQFLISARSEFRDCQNFCMPDLESYGGLGVIDEELRDQIDHVSHPEPYVECEQSTLELQFSMSIRLEIRAELRYINSNGQAVERDDFVFVNSSKQGFNIEARFQIAGHYVVKMHTRSESSASWKHYANYFVRSLGELNGLADEFPSIGKAWRRDNKLIKPRKKLLPINEHVPFSLQVNDPSIKEIYLYNKNKNESVRMSKNVSGLWQGSIKGYNSSAGSEVMILGGSDKNSCEELLTYRFETRDDRNIRNESISSAKELNIDRKNNEIRRLRKQENFDRQEKALELLPADPLKEREEEARRNEEEKQKKLREKERKRRRAERMKREREDERIRQIIKAKLSMYQEPSKQQKEQEKRKTRKQREEAFKQRQSSSARESRKSPSRRGQRSLTQRSEPKGYSTTEDSEGEAKYSFRTTPTKTPTDYKKELERKTKRARKSNELGELKALLDEIDERGFSQQALSKLEPDLSRAREVAQHGMEKQLLAETSAEETSDW